MRIVLCLTGLFCLGMISSAAASDVSGPMQFVAAAGPLHGVSGASPMRDGKYSRDGERPTAEDLIEKFADELNLDGQQRMDIQIIVADYQARLRDLVGIGRGIAQDLLAVPPDAPEYTDKSDESSAAAAAVTAEFVTLLAEMRGKLYSVLTAEQRARLNEIAAEQREKMRQKIEAKKSPSE